MAYLEDYDSFDSIMRGDRIKEVVSNYFKINKEKIVVIDGKFCGILTSEQYDEVLNPVAKTTLIRGSE